MRLYRLATPLAIAAVTILSARPALAQGGTAAPKIAYINSQIILQQAPGRAEAEAQFEKEMATYRQQVQRMGDSLNTMIAAYNKEEVSLSPAAKESRQKAIREKERAFGSPAAHQRAGNGSLQRFRHGLRRASKG